MSFNSSSTRPNGCLSDFIICVAIVVIMFSADESSDKADSNNVNDQPDETSHAGVTAETTTTGVPREGNNEVICYG